MTRRIGLFVCALTALAVGSPSAQPVVTGAVVRMDHEASGVVRWVGSSEPGRSSLTLDGGRHIWIDETTQVLSDGVPVMMSTLRPGTFVVVRSAKPLAMRDRGTAMDSPSALATRERAGVPVSTVDSTAPVVIYPDRAVAPTHSEIGLRERENERQAP